MSRKEFDSFAQKIKEFLANEDCIGSLSFINNKISGLFCLSLSSKEKLEAILQGLDPMDSKFSGVKIQELNKDQMAKKAPEIWSRGEIYFIY